MASISQRLHAAIDESRVVHAQFHHESFRVAVDVVVVVVLFVDELVVSI